MQCDVAIVGGSFAGLACAKMAAERGLDAVVLEKKSDPGALIHTTGLLVKEVADAWTIPSRFARKIHGVRLYGPSLASMDLTSPGYYFLATDTAALLRWFALEAEAAGARILLGTRYAGAVRVGARVAVGDLEALLLVGADGPRSSVARDFDLGTNEELLFGVEVELEGVAGVDEDRLHCFVDSKLAPGYIGWVVAGVGATQVGLATRAPERPDLDRFMAKISRVFDFSGARAIGRRGGPIPVGGPVRPFGRDGVVLIGDAAGIVSPLTAGGIHTALESGKRAGQKIADHLLDGGRAPHLELEHVYPAFTFKRMLRSLIDLRPPNRLIDGCLENAHFRRFAQAIFFHNRGLFSRAGLRAIVSDFRVELAAPVGGHVEQVPERPDHVDVT
jgi:flavin-dependent dehydrogenase